MLLAPCLALAVQFLSVRDFGAKGDGITVDTVAFQRAIDEAALHGGEVVVPSGRYLCGTIHLRSHVAIRLMAGSVVAESPNLKDFDTYEPLGYDPESDRETSDFAVALLAGKDIEDVSIYGPGVLDGNRNHRGNRGDKPGPKPIALKRCRGVRIRDVTVKNAPNYSVSLLGCSHVLIDGVTVENGYSDGIDPDSCSDVRISNCDVECYDDGICPKASLALGVPTVCENVTVTNCVVRSASNQFKLGTESNGGFRNITVSNLVCSPRIGKAVARRDRGGIALTLMDGGTMEGISIQNVTMHDLYSSIFVRLGDAGKHPVGRIRNVSISHVSGTGFQVPVILCGLPSRSIEDFRLQDIDCTILGGFKGKSNFEPKAKPIDYPESNMFGDPPAQALYARYVRGLTVNGCRFQAVRKDPRPSIVLDQVRDAGFRDLIVDGEAAVWTRQTVGAWFEGLSIPAGGRVLAASTSRTDKLEFGPSGGVRTAPSRGR